MSEQYPDLGITQSKDGDYWDIVVPDLDFDTDYALQAGWIYTNKESGISELSDRYNFTTIEQPGLLAPQFREQDLDAIGSILYVTWSGKDSSVEDYSESILKQVNIWIKGGDFGEQYVQYAGSFTKAGTIQINATKVSDYCVKLQAESKLGKFSSFSNEFCITLLEQPNPVFEVRHEWVKRDLVLFWKFDVALPKNSLSDSFAVQLIADGKEITQYTNVDPSKIPPIEHKIVFTESRLAAIFGQVTAFQTDYDAFIFVRDKNLQTSTVVGHDVSAYVDPLTAPVISVTKGSMSYNVSFTNNSEFDKIYIEDSTNSGATWVDQGSYTSNPVYVPTTNSLTRQVRARFSRVRGGYTGYSNIVSVTPDKIDQTDETPPDSIVSPTVAWSGSNLVVSFAMPAQNVPTDVEVYLTYSGLTKRFEKTIPTSTPSANTSVTIFKTEITDAWGADPLSFSAGYVTALDFYRNRNATQVNISNISSVVKSNALSGQITTISVSGAANGYVVSSNFHSAATGISVYQSSLESGTYTLVASSNSSPVVVYDEANAGNTVWVKAQWTSSTGNASMSTASSVQILDVGSLSLIENPVKIATDGSIFAGTLDASNNPILSQARMVINKRGLFLYDDNDLNGTSPTTQIIGKWDATNTNAPATFITQKAKIGNWIVSSDKFENVLTSGTNIYTGISPNGTYAFWAGAGVAGGYSTDITKDAKFSVTTSGNVIARNIKILGGEMQVGSKFTVNTDGKVSATDVVLTGEITAEKGTIKGNLSILQAGSLIARPLDTAPASSNRVTLSATGVFAYDANGTETTQIISNAEANAPTFTTDRAKIGGWVVSPTTISSTGITLTSGSTPGATSIIASNAGGYVGIKPKSSVGSEIVLWAGTTSGPGPNDGTGLPRAGFQVNADGQLYATGAIISGKITIESGSSLGGLLVDTSRIYSQNDEPSGGTYKTGDAWVDTNDNNKLYVYDSTKVAPVSKWVLAQDSASARAVADAKRIIVSATQLLTPLRPNFTPSNGVSFTSGDAWYNTSDGNKLYIYNGSAWILTQDSGVADGIAAKASLKARLNDGVNLELLKSLIVNTDGAHIYSSYSDISNVIRTKDSYDQDSIPGFFIGWHKPAGETKIWPAINIGTSSSYMKFSSYAGALEVKGTIKATGGVFEGNVTAGTGSGLITIGPNGITVASGKFSINSSGNATFGGTLTAGTILSEGTITGSTITGSTITTTNTGFNRVRLNSANSSLEFLNQLDTVTGTMYSFTSGELIIQNGNKSQIGYPASSGYVSVASGSVTIGRTNDQGVNIGGLTVDSTNATFTGVNVIAMQGSSLSTAGAAGSPIGYVRNIGMGTGAKSTADTDGVRGDIWIQYT
jgi:hypothetical protein